MNPEILETVKAADTGLSLSKPQLRQLQTEIAQLEQAGADAAAYRAKLLSDIGRSVVLAMPLQRRPQLFTKTEQTPTDNHAFCI